MAGMKRPQSNLALLAIAVVALMGYMLAYHFVGRRETIQMGGSTITCNIYDSKWKAIIFVPALRIEQLFSNKIIQATWMHDKSEKIEPF
jgi:hypothetical protein